MGNSSRIRDLLGSIGLIIILLIVALLISGAGYFFIKQQAIVDAKSKAAALLQYTEASRHFFLKHQKPAVIELMECKNRFFPELMLGFMIDRETWKLVTEEEPGYRYHQATLNPLNEEDRADTDELQIISEFRSDAELKKLDGIITKNEEEFVYVASPVKVERKSCLQCHGNPDDAPRFQVEVYGQDQGYGWNLDETVSASVVYVSLEEALQRARRRGIWIFFITFGGFILTLPFMGLFITHILSEPEDVDYQVL